MQFESMQKKNHFFYQFKLYKNPVLSNTKPAKTKNKVQNSYKNYLIQQRQRNASTEHHGILKIDVFFFFLNNLFGSRTAHNWRKNISVETEFIVIPRKVKCPMGLCDTRISFSLPLSMSLCVLSSTIDCCFFFLSFMYVPHFQSHPKNNDEFVNTYIDLIFIRVTSWVHI